MYQFITVDEVHDYNCELKNKRLKTWAKVVANANEVGELDVSI